MLCDGTATAGVLADALPAIANAVPVVAHRCRAVFAGLRFLGLCLARAMSESPVYGCEPAGPRGVPSSRKPINAGDHQHVAGPEKIEVRLQLLAAGSRRPAALLGADHLTAGRVERSLLNRQGLVSRADAIDR